MLKCDVKVQMNVHLSTGDGVRVLSKILDIVCDLASNFASALLDIFMKISIFCEKFKLFYFREFPGISNSQISRELTLL